MNKKHTFEEIFAQNKRRIYQMHKLHMQDPEQEFFQEGLIAMWNAYEKYDPEKVQWKHTPTTPFAQPLQQQRHRLQQKNYIHEQLTHYANNHKQLHKKASSVYSPFSNLLLDNPTVYKKLKPHLTHKQWKCFIFPQSK